MYIPGWAAMKLFWMICMNSGLSFNYDDSIFFFFFNLKVQISEKRIRFLILFYSLWIKAVSSHTSMCTAVSLATQSRWGNCVWDVHFASRVPLRCTEILAIGKTFSTRARYETMLVVINFMDKVVQSFLLLWTKSMGDNFQIWYYI